MREQKSTIRLQPVPAGTFQNVEMASLSEME